MALYNNCFSYGSFYYCLINNLTNAFTELIRRTPHRALTHTHTRTLMHALTQTDRPTRAYSGKQVTTVAPNVNENNTGTLTPKYYLS